MLAGQVSSTRKKQEFVIQSNSSSSQVISLYYKGSITIDWGDGTTNYLYSNNNTVSRHFHIHIQLFILGKLRLEVVLMLLDV